MTLIRKLTLGCAFVALPLAAGAETLSVVGTWSNLPLYQQHETPFWNETLADISDGALDADLTSFDQMGIDSGDVFRMLGDGVFDVGATVADYTVSDAPALEGLDVPLLANDAASAKAMVDAARPMVEDIMNANFNAHVLGIAPYPPQIVFCKGAVETLDDLKGKKIRGSGRMTTKLLEALGAEGINIAFAEVNGALERGVIDCAVTGAGSGYSAGWWEVSDHVVTLPLGGWDPVVYAINLDRWESLDADQQTILEEGVREHLDTVVWDQAQGGLDGDIACLTGNGECTMGEAASMVLVEPSDEDIAAAHEILESVVLPDWGKRAGAEWVARWNETVGAEVGVQIAE